MIWMEMEIITPSSSGNNQASSAQLSPPVAWSCDRLPKVYLLVSLSLVTSYVHYSEISGHLRRHLDMVNYTNIIAIVMDGLL